jgi:ParB/RepB/Spo0J family partition protein
MTVKSAKAGSVKGTEDVRGAWIELRVMQPSPTNPRKRFDGGKLEELRESIGQHGVLQDLLVRPRWCVGWHGGADRSGGGIEPYEIVAGERRYRAALLAGLTVAPCKVRALTDQEAIEIQLIENLQRKDLDAMEEADGYRQALEMRDEAGGAMWSVEVLAGRLGRTARHVHQRLKLLGLPGVAREALAEGELSAQVAVLIGRVPDGRLREKAAQEIIEGDGDGAWSLRVAEAHIERNYMRTTVGAPFDVADAALVPEAGACVTCPHLARNAPDVEVASGSGPGLRGDMCLNPACWARKATAGWERFRSAEGGEGRRVLSEKENGEAVQGSNFRTWASNLVLLDGHPTGGQLAAGARNGKTWRQLTAGRGIEVVVGRGEKGQAIYGVDVRQAIAAAKVNGHLIFPREDAEERRDYQAEQKREKAARDRRLEMAKRVGPMFAAKVSGEAGVWLRRLLVTVLDSGDDMVNAALLALIAGREVKELREDAEGKDDRKVCAAAALVVLAAELGWECQLDARGKGLLKEAGIDFAQKLRVEKARAEGSHIRR